MGTKEAACPSAARASAGDCTGKVRRQRRGPRTNVAKGLDPKRSLCLSAGQLLVLHARFGFEEGAGAGREGARAAAHCNEPLQSDGVRPWPQALMVMPLPERADVMRYNVRDDAHRAERVACSERCRRPSRCYASHAP